MPKVDNNTIALGGVICIGVGTLIHGFITGQFTPEIKDVILLIVGGLIGYVNGDKKIDNPFPPIGG